MFKTMTTPDAWKEMCLLLENRKQALDNAVNLISYPSNCADLLRDYARNVGSLVWSWAISGKLNLDVGYLQDVDAWTARNASYRQMSSTRTHSLPKQIWLRVNPVTATHAALQSK